MCGLQTCNLLVMLPTRARFHNFIHIDHFAKARFEDAKGQSFVWQFDSAMDMSYFPLKTIAPAGFDSGNVHVRVRHPLEHYDGN